MVNEDIDHPENGLRNIFGYVRAQIDFESRVFGHFHFPTNKNVKDSYNTFLWGE